MGVAHLGPMTWNRLLCPCVAAVALLALAAPDAEAQARGGAFESDKTFGLGIMLGAPTGLTGKVWAGGQLAIDFGVGTYVNRNYDDDLHAHVDVLWHPAVVASTASFDVPFYVGVGARVLEYDYYYYDDDYYYDGYTHVGVRVPFGLSMDFRRAPIDVFAEVVPVLDFVTDRDGRRDRRRDNFDLSGAMGVRYYF